MAMAPKKKFDFFNGGRGVNLNIYMEDTKSPPTPPPQQHQEREEVTHDSYIHDEWGRYPTGGPLACGRSSSSPSLHQGRNPHFEYPPEYPETTLSGNQSPTGYSEHSQSGYHSPNGYAPPSPIGMNSIGAPASHDSNISQDSVAWGSVNEDDDSRRKRKRHQRCRLCANHGVYVEVKGHKWYCPYRDAHNCDKCEITRKRQYYMAEQQKLTREQQQQLQAQHNRSNNNRSLCNTSAAGIPEISSSSAAGHNILSHQTHPRDFPRLDELVRETANIINEDLFEMINQVVRPRAKQ
ncbi:doublesex- and mab-3-related transcription factor 2-like [Palaemon carinicauda]|uniref:doublesex- and mab-3-related transcription factor 2-like n=1 Tax=Palaemon carinicauda TaxID=392227 RepID=UPI0035B5FA8B